MVDKEVCHHRDLSTSFYILPQSILNQELCKWCNPFFGFLLIQQSISAAQHPLVLNLSSRTSSKNTHDTSNRAGWRQLSYNVVTIYTIPCNFLRRTGKRELLQVPPRPSNGIKPRCCTHSLTHTHTMGKGLRSLGMEQQSCQLGVEFKHHNAWREIVKAGNSRQTR